MWLSVNLDKNIIIRTHKYSIFNVQSSGIVYRHHLNPIITSKSMYLLSISCMSTQCFVPITNNPKTASFNNTPRLVTFTELNSYCCGVDRRRHSLPWLFLATFIWLFGPSEKLFLGTQLFKAWCPLKGHTYLKKTCSWKLQVCLSMYDLLVEIRS